MDKRGSQQVHVYRKITGSWTYPSACLQLPAQWWKCTEPCGQLQKFAKIVSRLTIRARHHVIRGLTYAFFQIWPQLLPRSLWINGLMVVNPKVNHDCMHICSFCSIHQGVLANKLRPRTWDRHGTLGNFPVVSPAKLETKWQRWVLWPFPRQVPRG
jgi:hypothetical protein